MGTTAVHTFFFHGTLSKSRDALTVDERPRGSPRATTPSPRAGGPTGSTASSAPRFPLGHSSASGPDSPSLNVSWSGPRRHLPRQTPTPSRSPPLSTHRARSPPPEFFTAPEPPSCCRQRGTAHSDTPAFAFGVLSPKTQETTQQALASTSTTSGSSWGRPLRGLGDLTRYILEGVQTLPC